MFDRRGLEEDLMHGKLMLGFSNLAYIGSGTDGVDPGPARIGSEIVKALKVRENKWQLVWGPALHPAPGCPMNDVMAYAVKHRERNEIVVAYRGTGPLRSGGVGSWLGMNSGPGKVWPGGKELRTAPKLNNLAHFGLTIAASLCSEEELVGGGDSPMSLEDFLLQELKGSPQGAQKMVITTTGHGAGGVLAAVAALSLKERPQIAKAATIQCCTFGTPAIGDANFAAYYDSKLKGTTLRFCNNLDVVPVSGRVAGTEFHCVPTLFFVRGHPLVFAIAIAVGTLMLVLPAVVLLLLIFPMPWVWWAHASCWFTAPFESCHVGKEIKLEGAWGALTPWYSAQAAAQHDAYPMLLEKRLAVVRGAEPFNGAVAAVVQPVLELLPHPISTAVSDVLAQFLSVVGGGVEPSNIPSARDCGSRLRYVSDTLGFRYLLPFQRLVARVFQRVFAFVGHGQGSGPNVLPVIVKAGQHLSREERLNRLAEVEEARTKLRVSYDTLIKDVAMLERVGFPKQHLPSREWIRKVFNVLLKVQLTEDAAGRFQQLRETLLTYSASSAAIEGNGDDPHTLILTLFDLVHKVFHRRAEATRPTTLAEYDEIYELFRPLPQISLEELDSDPAFARYRLSGYVPNKIEKATEGLLKDMKWSEVENSDLKEKVKVAQAEDRLYAVDYGVLKTLPVGEGKYLGYPVALFEIPKDPETRAREGLLVLCIQCLKGVPTSTFTSGNLDWTWKMAKLLFNQCESNYHEGVSHLADTHLVVEAIALPMFRTLPKGHPVALLLSQHLEGTLFINWLADRTLIEKGGGVETLLAPKIEAVHGLVSASVQARLEEDLTFPATMRAKGLDSDSFPTTYYPYREFATELWDVTRSFVESYVDVWYKTDEDVNNDPELESFRQELIEVGRVKWVEKKWKKGMRGSKGFLIELLSSCIFTGSTQHAAVNFTQGSHMSAVNVVPLALYQEPPQYPDQYTDEKSVAAALPNMMVAYLQRDVTHILSTHYTTLGQYNDGIFSGPSASAVAVFKKNLQSLKIKLQRRNQEWIDMWQGHTNRVPPSLVHNWAYTTLLPDMIPQSVNI